jgi:hypothetical protein
MKTIALLITAGLMSANLHAADYFTLGDGVIDTVESSTHDEFPVDLSGEKFTLGDGVVDTIVHSTHAEFPVDLSGEKFTLGDGVIDNIEYTSEETVISKSEVDDSSYDS